MDLREFGQDYKHTQRFLWDDCGAPGAVLCFMLPHKRLCQPPLLHRSWTGRRRRLFLTHLQQNQTVLVLLGLFCKKKKVA